MASVGARCVRAGCTAQGSLRQNGMNLPSSFFQSLDSNSLSCLSNVANASCHAGVAFSPSSPLALRHACQADSLVDGGASSAAAEGGVDCGETLGAGGGDGAGGDGDVHSDEDCECDAEAVRRAASQGASTDGDGSLEGADLEVHPGVA